MKHTYIILALAALLVAPTTYAAPATDAAGMSNTSVKVQHTHAVPMPATDGYAPSQDGNNEEGNPPTSPQKARSLDATLKADRAGGVEAVHTHRENMHNAVETAKARMQEMKTEQADHVEAIRGELKERLSEIPRWIIGVCASTATCEETKTALKAKCEELSTATTDASGVVASTVTCNNIEELTCDDIEKHCAHIVEKKEDVENRLGEVRAKVEEKRGEIKENWNDKKEALKENAKNRIDAYIARLIDRIHAAINRLTKLTDRIEERIDILEEEGIDASEAQASVDAASDHLAAAEEYLADVETLSADALATDTPRESISIIKEAIRAAAEEVRAARADLKEALRYLKSNSSGNTE
ncbi:MAG: hypothetical protein H8D63_02615 [Parcubacteria group bacterium]|nr:hypothetical protein [Parcubacteria group bacterium]